MTKNEKQRLDAAKRAACQSAKLVGESLGQLNATPQPVPNRRQTLLSRSRTFLPKQMLRKLQIAARAVVADSNFFLKDRYYFVLKAICAGPMRWFRCLDLWLVNLGERPMPKIFKRVLLLFRAPIFELFVFFGKTLCTFQERHFFLRASRVRDEGLRELLLKRSRSAH